MEGGRMEGGQRREGGQTSTWESSTEPWSRYSWSGMMLVFIAAVRLEGEMEVRNLTGEISRKLGEKAICRAEYEMS